MGLAEGSISYADAAADFQKREDEVRGITRYAIAKHVFLEVPGVDWLENLSKMLAESLRSIARIPMVCEEIPPAATQAIPARVARAAALDDFFIAAHVEFWGLSQHTEYNRDMYLRMVYFNSNTDLALHHPCDTASDWDLVSQVIEIGDSAGFTGVVLATHLPKAAGGPRILHDKRLFPEPSGARVRRLSLSPGLSRLAGSPMMKLLPALMLCARVIFSIRVCRVTVRKRIKFEGIETVLNADAALFQPIGSRKMTQQVYGNREIPTGWCHWAITSSFARHSFHYTKFTMAGSSILTLLASFVAAYAGYRLYLGYALRLIAQQHGCQPAARYKHIDPVFGLDIFLKTGDAISKNKFLVEHQRRYDTYGHTFESLNLGSHAISSIHPENLRAVFSKNAADWGVQPLRLHNMGPFCGAGFITTDGADWKISHDLLKPGFHRSNISDFGHLEEHLQILLSQVPKDGSKFDLQPYLLKLYLDLNTLFLFGEPIGMLSGTPPAHAEGFLDAFQAGFNGCGLRIALGPLNFLMPKGSWLKACDKVHKFADTYVDRALEYRGKVDSVEHSHDEAKRRTLLFNMAQATDNRILLRNQAVQAMMAATETTASLISHVIRNLASHPTVADQVRAEVLALGDKPLDFDTLPRIRSLQHVITETLRLYPVFPQNNRVALRDTILPTGGGPDGTAPVFAPAGTLFDVCFATLHRDPKIWGPDADEFVPSRWENDYSPPPFTFLPFGAGPRQCLAQQKATMEASYIVSRILQEFSGIKSEDDKPYQAQVALTAKSAHGCPISLIPAT